MPVSTPMLVAGDENDFDLSEEECDAESDVEELVSNKLTQYQTFRKNPIQRVNSHIYSVQEENSIAVVLDTEQDGDGQNNTPQGSLDLIDIASEVEMVDTKSAVKEDVVNNVSSEEEVTSELSLYLFGEEIERNLSVLYYQAVNEE